ASADDGFPAIWKDVLARCEAATILAASPENNQHLAKKVIDKKGDVETLVALFGKAGRGFRLKKGESLGIVKPVVVKFELALRDKSTAIVTVHGGGLFLKTEAGIFSADFDRRQAYRV